MADRKLADLFREYRQRKSLSQGDLAHELGVTQATVSRVESEKQLLKPRLFAKFIGLYNETAAHTLEKPIEKRDRTASTALPVARFVDGGEVISKNDWNYHYAIMQLDGAGGDLCRVRELEKGKSYGFVIGDAVGHGVQASYMSFAIEFAFEAISSFFTPSVLQPEMVESFLAQGIGKTAVKWRGEPSLAIGNINPDRDVVELINRGMPYPLWRTGSKTEMITSGRGKAFELSSPTTTSTATALPLKRGEALLFYTDGLLDLINDSDLKVFFGQTNSLFRGDSKAMAKSLIKTLDRSTSKTDDASFLIVSRRKAGK